MTVINGVDMGIKANIRALERIMAKEQTYRMVKAQLDQAKPTSGLSSDDLHPIGIDGRSHPVRHNR